MEDVVRIVDDSESGVLLALICDGHGSVRVAEWMAEHAPARLFEASRRYVAELSRATTEGGKRMLAAVFETHLKRVVIQLDRDGFRAFGDDMGAGGCTFLAAMLFPYVSQVVWINVGDSRGWMYDRVRRQSFATMDHKPTHPDERTRIHAAQGWVSRDARVNGNLALSRALGDWQLKRCSTATAPSASVDDGPVSSIYGPVCGIADVHVQPLGSDSILVLASDGVWDTMAHSDLLPIVDDPAGRSTNAAETVVQSAYARGSTDNLSAIVIRYVG